jgi:hypothetical protein
MSNLTLALLAGLSCSIPLGIIALIVGPTWQMAILIFLIGFLVTWAVASKFLD